MGRYNYSESRNTKPEKSMHPIWRAVGFAMVILIPLMGFAAATLILDENRKQSWFKIPKDLLGPSGDSELWIRLIIAAVVMFLLYIIYSLVTFLLTRAMSPNRYGPYDAPPSSRKVKRYKR
jgi:hypothetical protein